MGTRTANTSEDDARRQARAVAIETFLQEHAGSPHGDLLGQMMVTLCRLAADGVDRGDLKLLNSSLAELRYALKTFAPYRDRPKVTVFGSARTPRDHPQYEQARLFGELMQQAGWMIITGAGPGIMQAGHDGATAEASFGVSISLPFEESVNPVIAKDPKLVNFRYFFTRKLMFVKEAGAIALFPGGFGTQDECFEALTLIQTGKDTPKPIVLVDEPGGVYWQRWCDYIRRELLDTGMIDVTDLHLLLRTDSAEEARAEILNFYRRYHSSRFLGDQFVIRLQSPVRAETVAELNDTFGDLLVGGAYEVHDGPLSGEEELAPQLPRLAFAYNRRGAGRLRQLIDRVNRDPLPGETTSDTE